MSSTQIHHFNKFKSLPSLPHEINNDIAKLCTQSQSNLLTTATSSMITTMFKNSFVSRSLSYPLASKKKRIHYFSSRHPSLDEEWIEAKVNTNKVKSYSPSNMEKASSVGCTPLFVLPLQQDSRRSRLSTTVHYCDFDSCACSDDNSCPGSNMTSSNNIHIFNDSFLFQSSAESPHVAVVSVDVLPTSQKKSKKNKKLYNNEPIIKSTSHSTPTSPSSTSSLRRRMSLLVHQFHSSSKRRLTDEQALITTEPQLKLREFRRLSPPEKKRPCSEVANIHVPSFTLKLVSK